MKKLLYVLFLLPIVVFANPEISNDGPVHFPIDPANANHEHEPITGNCEGGVTPDGNRIADGQVTCKFKAMFKPWDKIAPNDNVYTISSNDANYVCELFAEDSNAGNNQGNNVTQYDANNWQGVYVAQLVGGIFPYDITMNMYCIGGVQQ